MLNITEFACVYNKFSVSPQYFGVNVIARTGATKQSPIFLEITPNFFAVALREKKNFESLVREKICRPLRMKDTGILLSPDQQKRFAEGYDLAGNPAPSWDFSVLAGGGAGYSVVHSAAANSPQMTTASSRQSVV